MNMKNRTGCIIIALLLCGTAPALAQTTPSTPQHIQLQKTIGEQDKPEIVPSLIVMNARGASLQGGKLTLTGVAPNSIVFADRPVRAAGHSLLTNLLEEWSPSNDSDESFTKDPPNATVSVFSTDGSKVRDAVVVLKTAKLEGDRLTRVGRVGVGRVGAVGVWHRPYVARGAWYRGAAVGAAAVGGAALGAAAAGAYSGYGAACGYYPNPPCY